MMSVAVLDFLFNVSAAGSGPFSGLHKAWRDAWEAGQKLLKELKAAPFAGPMTAKTENRSKEKCPHSIILSSEEFLQRGEGDVASLWPDVGFPQYPCWEAVPSPRRVRP